MTPPPGAVPRRELDAAGGRRSLLAWTGGCREAWARLSSLRGLPGVATMRDLRRVALGLVILPTERDIPRRGETAGRNSSTGRAALYRILGRDGLELLVADTTWRNRDRDLSVVDRGISAQRFDRLGHGLRRTIRSYLGGRNGFLADALTVDLRQAHVRADNWSNLFAADEPELGAGAGAGVGVVEWLQRVGAIEVGTRAELLDDRVVTQLHRVCCLRSRCRTRPDRGLRPYAHNTPCQRVQGSMNTDRQRMSPFTIPAVRARSHASGGRAQADGSPPDCCESSRARTRRGRRTRVLRGLERSPGCQGCQPARARLVKPATPHGREGAARCGDATGKVGKVGARFFRIYAPAGRQKLSAHVGSANLCVRDLPKSGCSCLSEEIACESRVSSYKLSSAPRTGDSR
jgi:hypothetical protein